MFIVEDDQKHVWTAARKVRHSTDYTAMKRECLNDLERASVKGQVSARVLADCLRKLGWRDADIAEAIPGNNPFISPLSEARCVSSIGVFIGLSWMCEGV